MDDPQPTDRQQDAQAGDGDDLPIVGIGASAGGLDALQAFVSHLSTDSGLAYIVAQHLSPDHRSVIDQLLSARTSVPVSMIADGERIEKDHIYIVPPGYELIIESDLGRLVERSRGPVLRTPIDTMLSSLAEAKGRHAYCVILSGTGSDGTQGVRNIKAAGGLAIVQKSDTARFPGMPDSAQATGLVDFVLRAEDIPARLQDIARHRSNHSEAEQRKALETSIENHLHLLVSLLAKRHGHDFSRYKPGTLVRRVERRMGLLRIKTVEMYIERLGDDEEEAARLFQDFLIGVTRFFRDQEVFNVLEREAIKPLVESDRQEFRIWVPGCSTGEEAYSIAIVFLAAMEERGDYRPLKVFGTDIDEAALLQARHGLFPTSAMETMPPQYLKRWFTDEYGMFKAVPQLREVCIFAPHNVVQDPPFSRLDLISCRNLLIYMDTSLQQRIIPRFHFALREGGHLQLGPSEGLAGEDAFFRPVNKGSRLFVRDDRTPTRYSPLEEEKPRPRQRYLPLPERSLATHITEREVHAEQIFLQRRAHPFALVNEAGLVSYVSESMSGFIRPSKGTPSADIDAYLLRDLRLPVRSALNDAVSTQEEVRIENILVEKNDEREIYDVVVEPASDDNDQYLITLERIRTRDVSTIAGEIRKHKLTDRDKLAHELASARKQLRMAQGEFEISSQKLQSTNEELLSMNEELQSSNEELETSREELQSINEELETVNAELSENNNQLQRANNDVKNLLESTDLAVLFLDPQLCVRSFTPSTSRLFGIKERDLGRPIDDLSSRVDYTQLAEDTEKVSQTLQTVEREVRIDSTGETFLLQMKPYRTTDDRLDGFVLTFIDITERTRADQQLQRYATDLKRQYAELETLYDTTPVGLSLMDRELRWVRINKTLADINGFPIDEHIGRRQDELIPDIDSKIAGFMKQVLTTGEAVLGIEVQGVTPAEPDTTREWLVDYYPVRSGDDVFAVGTCVREVTEQKQLMRDLEAAESRFRRLLDSAPMFVAIHEGPDHVYRYTNPPLDSVLGDRNLIGMSIAEAVPELVGQGVIERFDKVYDTGQRLYTEEFQAAFDRGEDDRDNGGWFAQVLDPWRDSDGNIVGVASFAYEITDQVRAREQIKGSEERKTVLLAELQHRVKNTLATVSAIAQFLAEGVDSVEDYQKRLSNRLGLISRTHDILTATDWRSAQLSDLLDMEMAPFAREDRSRYILKGDGFELSPKETLSLGLGVHEMITNALKYGAFSTPEGSVEITAHAEGAEWTKLPRVMTWKEHGGPEVPETITERGFGSFLIEKVLVADLSAEAEIIFERDGLLVRIALP